MQRSNSSEIRNRVSLYEGNAEDLNNSTSFHNRTESSDRCYFPDKLSTFQEPMQQNGSVVLLVSTLNSTSRVETVKTTNPFVPAPWSTLRYSDKLTRADKDEKEQWTVAATLIIRRRAIVT